MTRSTTHRRLSCAIVIALTLASAGFAQKVSADVAAEALEAPAPAQAIMLGKGVGAKQINTPHLLSEAPVLGSNPLMRLKGLTPRSSGVIYVGAPATQPLRLGDSACLWLDLGSSKSWIAIPYEISPEGGFDLPLSVPADPGLAGLSIVFQAFASVEGAPEITNGMLWVLGS